MSRQYDAKLAVLKAYPEDKEAGIDMFIGYCDMGQEDIEYELGKSIEQYVYGTNTISLTE